MMSKHQKKVRPLGRRGNSKERIDDERCLCPNKRLLEQKMRTKRRNREQGEAKPHVPLSPERSIIIRLACSYNNEEAATVKIWSGIKIWPPPAATEHPRSCRRSNRAQKNTPEPMLRSKGPVVRPGGVDFEGLELPGLLPL